MVGAGLVRYCLTHLNHTTSEQLDIPSQRIIAEVMKEKAGLTRSMSQKGCTADNAACEGVFGRVKNEMFYNRSWAGVSIEEFMDTLNGYLHWYNEKRIKMSLGAMSPMEYRNRPGWAG